MAAFPANKHGVVQNLRKRYGHRIEESYTH